MPRVHELIADADSPIPMSLRTPLAELCDELFILNDRLKELDHQLAALADQIPQVALLQTIPGIGVLSATALVACVGDVRRFPSGRHFASYLGLTPREHSSGGRRQLGAMSKQGDQYLRTLLMHAARGTLSHSYHPERATLFRRWARRVAERRGANIAIGAIANRLARMVYRVWWDERPFVVAGSAAA